MATTRNFKAINLLRVYDTSSGDLTADFFRPLLEHSVSYSRGVGYFSSGWLQVNCRGMASFAKAKGRARWVTSPILNRQDWKAIRLGVGAGHELFEASLNSTLDDLEEALEIQTLATLSALVAEGILEFRIAVPRNRLDGEFHDKFGIFRDADGHQVSFAGSYNDSNQGTRNYESIKVFRSWQPSEQEIVEADIRRFERLWNDEDPNVRVYEVPEVVRRRLIKLRNKYPLPMEEDDEGQLNSDRLVASVPTLPHEIELRPYQADAIKAWFSADGRGIFEMATGSGKTIAALGLAEKLSSILRKRDKHLAVVVVCPYRHLVTQWAREAQRFNFQPIKCSGSRTSWQDKLSSRLTSLNARAIGSAFCVTTNATFGAGHIQKLLEGRQFKTLLIGDEVHNLGSEVYAKALPEDVKYRLGLSATPERWFDVEGTQTLYDYFGEPVFEMGLQEAIEEEFLTPYDYHPVLVELTRDEQKAYLKLSRQIAKAMSSVGDDIQELDPDEGVQRLLFKRARLVGSASNKLDRLRDVMTGREDTTHNLIYCGDGRVETSPTEDLIRHIEAVTEVLGRDLHMKVATYTAETHINDREDIRRDFKEGRLQGIVAIRCLDEGVDIPETRNAFILASTSNPRQWIQRRGRILRRSEGKDFAEIWDFIVIPPDEVGHDDQFNAERSLVRKELKRVSEFASMARNGPIAQGKLRELKSRFNLMDM